MYAAIKILHIVFAGLSVAGLAVRGFLVARHSPLARQRWMRIAPHINDTLLLAAGAFLALASHQYPFVDAWITAKLAAVLVYILLGAAALRPSLSLGLRAACAVGALLVAAYIVSVALTKHALL